MTGIAAAAAGPAVRESGLQLLVNGGARQWVPGAARTREPLSVHRRLPGYARTPLTSYPGLAAELGVAEVRVKDETHRLGLPAFKMLGASYAVCRALTRAFGLDDRWRDVTALRAALAPHTPLTLSAATDGNHGRAVARMARLLGLSAAIYVPAGMTAERIAAIRSEGAAVTVVDGDYDEAVRRSARDASAGCLVISDTSWPGYTATPRWVVQGYSTIFAEIDDQLAATGASWPDVVVIPVGVGALAGAAVNYLKPEHAEHAPLLLGVEPSSASCVQQSLRAGHLVTVPGPHPSIMVGLNCGTPSLVTWPLVSAGLDAMAGIPDDWARQAMRKLAGVGVVAGETGAAALGGLMAVLGEAAAAEVRTALGLGPRSSVLLLATEGATDRTAWAQIVGRPAPSVPDLEGAG